MASSLQHMAAAISDRSTALINNDLKKILREEGSSQSGNKAALQARVLGLITNAVQQHDAEALRRLQYRVQHHGDAPPPSSTSSSAPIPHHPAPTHNGFSMTNAYQQTRETPLTPSFASFPQQQQQHQVPARPTYFFKDSPFLEIRELILGNIVLEASPSHRQNTTRTLALSDSQCARLKSDNSLRLLLFSAIEQPLAQFTRLDIAFPSQIEVRINGDDIKANYRGLKNKPGSTRPADITRFVRITPANHRNTLVITYALTQKASAPEKFNLFVFMAKKFSVEELTRRIKDRNVITRQSVLNEMMKKANDADIEVGSSVMSLKDPISTLRMKVPCRSTICTHSQCFDAESFLQLQEQAPTWTCPICNKTISYEGLAVDQYVEDILNKAGNADQVTIEPNGEWSAEKDTPPKTNGYGAHDDDSDDDIVEIPAYRVKAIKNEFAPSPISLGTPSLTSREASTAPRSGSKRTAEVVDLTLSDDDEPVRPAKKVAISTPNSLPDTSSRRFQLPPLGGSNSAPHSRPMPPSYHTMPSGLHSVGHRALPTTARNPYGSYQSIPSASRLNYPGPGAPTYPSHFDSSP